MNSFFSVRLSFCIFFLFLTVSLSAQTPPSGLNGPALRNWLKVNFYDGKHTDLGYSTARARMYGHIDNVNNTIVCVYGGYQHPWAQGSTGTNPTPVNAEHTVPQSFFGGSGPIRSDIHHLYPVFDQWNSNRSNHPFGEIADAQTTTWMRLTQSQSSIPSSNIAEYSEGISSLFEPREDHKGDCARAIFYIFTMYNIPGHDIHDLGNITTLYQWHQDDPPSTKEMQRNDGIESWQGNRNPYIDHPEWLGPAWGFGVPAPSEPMNVQVLPDTNQLMITWDDVMDETGYYLFRSTDNSNFTLLDSTMADSTTYLDTNVLGGLSYYYYVVAYNAVGNGPNSATVSGIPISGMGSGGFASDLIISEYIEGSLFNKVIEIANGTGEIIDLSLYSLQKQLNGSGAWGDEVAMSGMLADGDVWVIASSAADATILAQADVSSNSNLMLFNGNDPIGLFKEDSLIDVVGLVDGGSVDFGEDVSLVRKSYIVSPTAVYDTTEWTAFPENEIENLGFHIFDPSTNGIDAEQRLVDAIRLWPNPGKDQLFLSFDIRKAAVISLDVLDVMGRTMSLEMDAQHVGLGPYVIPIAIDQLSTGIYYLRLQTDNREVSFRFVKQE